MKSLNKLMILSIAVFTYSSTAHACGCEAKETFNKIKSLAGYWESDQVDPMTKKRESVLYKVTSGGTAVQEILMPGTSHEMVTVYTIEGDTVGMTHYCMLGNQPHLQVTKADGNEIHFAFEGGANIDADKDMHMHDLTMTLISPSKLKHEWVSYNGTKKEEGKVFTFSKKG